MIRLRYPDLAEYPLSGQIRLLLDFVSQTPDCHYTSCILKSLLWSVGVNCWIRISMSQQSSFVSLWCTWCTVINQSIIQVYFRQKSIMYTVVLRN